MIKQSMSEKNRAAHQANGRKSRGAATPEGKERTRAAHLRHGFYSQQRSEALQALGEDPAELAALIADTQAELQPASDFQARITERMARLWWRMERAERIQQSLMVQHKQENDERRDAEAVRLRLERVPKEDLLDAMVKDLLDPRFYTARHYFRMFDEAFGDKPQGRDKIVLELMHRLRKPKNRGSGFGVRGSGQSQTRGTGNGTRGTGDGVRDKGNGTRDKEQAQTRDTGFGVRDSGEPLPSANLPLDSNAELPVPNPESRVPDPETPTPCPVSRIPCPDPPDVYLQDMAEWDDDDFPIPWPKIPIATGKERDELREELLYEARELLQLVHRALDPPIEKQERPLSPSELDQVLAEPHPHAELMRREEESCFRQFMRLGNYLLKVQTRAEKRAKNEGSSGYVDENKVRDTGNGTRDTGRAEIGKVQNAESEAGNPDFTVGSAESEVQNSKSGVGSPKSEARKGRVVSATAGQAQ